MRLMIIAAVLVFISCGGGEIEETASIPEPIVEDPATDDTADVADTVEARSDSIINVTVGEDFTIDLDANPTTGYHWDLLQIEQQDCIVEQAGEPEYVPDTHDEGMVGVGGTETWYFHSNTEGDAVIEFGYFAPGADSTDAPGRVANFKVIVT